MHSEVLTPNQLAVLDALTDLRPLRKFYLAGGTALGLRHGHRRSIDFDWFRPDGFDGHQLTAALEARFDQFEPMPSGAHTIYVRLLGVTASFFKLPYPLLEPTDPTPWGFGLASDRDIAAMKLEAIAGRGARKGFIDLYTLCRHQGITLEEVFSLFERKYGSKGVEKYHRLRALSYFEDAENEPMPDLLLPIEWSNVRSFFQTEAARLLKTDLAT